MNSEHQRIKIEEFNLKPIEFTIVRVITDKRLNFNVYHYEVEVIDNEAQSDLLDLKEEAKEFNKIDALSHVKNSHFPTVHECKTEILKAIELILTY